MGGNEFFYQNNSDTGEYMDLAERDGVEQVSKFCPVKPLLMVNL